MDKYAPILARRYAHQHKIAEQYARGQIGHDDRARELLVIDLEAAAAVEALG